MYSDGVPFDDGDQVHNRKHLALVGVCLAAAVFGGIAVAGLLGAHAPAAFSVQSGNQNAAITNASSEQAPSTQQLVVHVLGCVANPGVYEVPDGSRVADVVQLAGGMTDQACQEGVNLASKVTDGSQIIIQSKEEASAQKPETGLSQGGVAAAPSAQVAGKVNINTATSDQLQTLNGIGQATAAKIISYREKNGPFKNVDDLTNVSGIGEKRLATLRNQITV